MLVENPHDLGCVHSGTATESDDHVGLKSLHCLGTALSAGECGIGLNIEELSGRKSELAETLRDDACESVLVKETVGNDERFFLVHASTDLV